VIKERISGGDKQHLRRLFSLRNDYLLPIHGIFNLDSHSPDVDIVSNTHGKKKNRCKCGKGAQTKMPLVHTGSVRDLK